MPQDCKGHVHLRGARLVVLPQGPGHPWQGGQEAAIDGGQLGQGLLVGQRHVGAQLGSQRGQDIVQQHRVEDVRGFTERPQRRSADAEALLHLGQRRGLWQAAQAGHRRVEKVQQHQGRILIVKQPPVAGAVPLGANDVQMGEERPEHAKVLEALEGLRRDRRTRCSSHAGLLVILMSRSLQRLPHARHALYPQQKSCRTLLFASPQGALIPLTPQETLVLYRPPAPRRQTRQRLAMQQLMLFEFVQIG
jgi:hypothetical protein